MIIKWFVTINLKLAIHSKSMKTIINVTQKDIDESVCGNAFKCAVANATNRVLNSDYCFGVCAEFGHIFRKDPLRGAGPVVILPTEVSVFLSKFDSPLKRGAKPFEFILDVDKEYVKEIIK